jgi:7-alpha-hydroxysteroid dehydrogenase
MPSSASGGSVPDTDLVNRVAIVTGGGWNIGRGIACAFARAGAKVVVAARDAARLERTVARIREDGGEALAVPADATRTADLERVVAAARERFGGVHVAAAIAGGGGGFEPVDAIAPETWEAVVRQNLFTTFQLARAVLPHFRRQDDGVFLTCAGAGAFFPMLGWHATAYACAKAAICRFTDQLTAELWTTRIRVNGIEPGQVWNEDDLRAVAAEEARTGTPHPGRQHNRSPEEAGELAVWLASEASRAIRGRIVSVNDTWWRDPAQVARVAASEHLYRVHRHHL